MGQDVQAWIQFGSVTYPIKKHGTIRIGRSIDSDVRLFEDTAISREHCIVKSVSDRLEVTDLDSRNGTRINGKRISRPTKLYHRDIITVGDSELKILFELDKDSTDTESDVPLAP